ncbi:hypothetical protein DW907_00020 [Holdemanella biformis]|uniref:Uncharacterized protein n=2 Tax=Holdemanella biformis TaxID=1735 RepID=A0A413UG56_9FIRM|nr:hypothetical protein DW907_00020 [Holdemanella biformis]
MSMSAELKVDIVFNIFFCSLGLMVQDDVAGRLMDGIHIHRAKSDDVNMMAERSMQMMGFLFLNINDRISKQNKVCIAHIA